MARHLTPEERDVIAQRLAAGVTRKQIAAELHRSGSTIYRELRFNSVGGIYLATSAQRLSEQRRRLGRQKSRKLEQPALQQAVQEKLREAWSPEQIAGRLKRSFPNEFRQRASRQTIYTWLARHDHRRRWAQWLRRHKQRRRPRREPRPACRNLAHRPEVVNRRERLGDWEGDSIVGKRSGGGALLSLVERRSGLVELIFVPDLQAHTVSRAIRQRLAKYPPHLRRSITFDNGSEFAAHQWLAKHLYMDVYFADPRSPWQRGTNENTNGLVRQFFPQGTDFTQESRYRIQQVQDLLNNRPRKRHGYQTPNEILHQPCQHAIQT